MPRGDDDERAAVCAPPRRRRLPRVALEVRALPDMLELAPAEVELERARASAESLRSGSESPSPQLFSLLALAAREQRSDAPCVRLLADACVDSLLEHRSFASLRPYVQMLMMSVPMIMVEPATVSTRRLQHLAQAGEARTVCGREVGENWVQVAIDQGHVRILTVTRHCSICARAADEGSTPYSFQWLADTRRHWGLSVEEQERMRASCRDALFGLLSAENMTTRSMLAPDRLSLIGESVLSHCLSLIADRLVTRADPKLWLRGLIEEHADLRKLLDDVYDGRPPVVGAEQIAGYLRLAEEFRPNVPAMRLSLVFLSTWPKAIPELRRRAYTMPYVSMLAKVNSYLVSYGSAVTGVSAG